jgi:hypothetical protein
MRAKNIFLAIIVVACLGGVAFAADEPALQITNYSTVPSSVYPGALGYLQITLANKGTAAADTVTAYYNVGGVAQTSSSGSISSGSSAQLSIPFKIPQEAGGSIQLLSVDIYYTYTLTSGGAASKKTSISIPILVLQQSPLEVRTVSTGKMSIAPGEKFDAELELKNTGGVVNNLVITMPQNSTFTIEGSTQKAVGSIAPNSTVKVKIGLVSSSSTAIGTYGVPVLFTYQDALLRPFEETLYVGPLSVLDASAQYRLSLVPSESVEIGSLAQFRLTLQNTGSVAMSATVDINSTDVFMPIGMQKVYFDSVKPGESSAMDITIGVDSGTSAGYYSLPLRLTTSTGQSAVFYTGISVDATPEVTVTLDAQNSQVQIANTGNSNIRSVHAVATSASGAKTDSFIGTLSVDDFATLSLPAGALGSVDVEIRFRDSNNFEHTVKNALQLGQGAGGNSTFRSGGASAGGFAGNAGTGTGGQRSNNPLGFLLGPGGRAAGTQSLGIDPVFLGAGAAVVIVVGYFAYKRWKGKKGAAHPPTSGGQPPVHAQDAERGRKPK